MPSWCCLLQGRIDLVFQVGQILCVWQQLFDCYLVQVFDDDA